MTLRKPQVSSTLDQSAIDRATSEQVGSNQAAPGSGPVEGFGRRKSTLRDRLRRKRRENRHSLMENLETRQLLAGPDLIGIQPNQGALLQDGTQLTVSPRELVFQFDDNANIDPDTLSAIRITRAGEDRVFESATATSDLGTSGQVLLEFRAAQQGSIGNGIQVEFEVSNRPNNPVPLVTVSDRTVTIAASKSKLAFRRLRISDQRSPVCRASMYRSDLWGPVMPKRTTSEPLVVCTSLWASDNSSARRGCFMWCFLTSIAFASATGDLFASSLTTIHLQKLLKACR